MTPEEKFEELGQETGQKRGAARTEERFPIEFQPITEAEFRSLERTYLAKRTAERDDVAGAGDEMASEQFQVIGVSQGQLQMFNQIIRTLRQIEQRLEEILAAVSGKEVSRAKMHKAMCVDLSAGGMRMISAHSLQKGDRVKVVLPLPPPHPVVLSAIGRVVKLGEVRLGSGKKAFESALHFEAINEQDRDEIVAYSFKRQREMAFKGGGAEGEEG